MTLQDFLGGEVHHVQPWIKDAVVVDIGAHQGAFTLWAAEHDARFIHAYEPLLYNYSQLLANTSHLTNINLYLAAVGRETGRCDLVVPDGETSGTFVIPGNDHFVMGWDGVQGIGPIDVLKVDIEGNEYDLFPGADLTSVAHFVIETHNWTVDGEPASPGVGHRSGPSRRENAYEELLAWVERTHWIEVYGSSDGGFVVGSLR